MAVRKTFPRGYWTEGEGAKMLQSGLSVKEIAAKAGVSEVWVKKAKYRPRVVEPAGLAERLVLRAAELLGPAQFEDLAFEMLEKALSRTHEAISAERTDLQRQVQVLQREKTALEQSHQEQALRRAGAVNGE